nr:MAG TPA: hypothetical protein [Caudoviricetes sp.]
MQHPFVVDLIQNSHNPFAPVCHGFVLLHSFAWSAVYSR